MDISRLLSHLQDIHDAPDDSRDFVAFEKRPDMIAAGVPAKTFDGFNFGSKPAVRAAMGQLQQQASLAPRVVSVPIGRVEAPPKHNLTPNESQRQSDNQMARDGLGDRRFPGLINLPNHGKRYPTLAAAAIAAKDDLLRTFPASKAVETGVKFRKKLFGGYTYSNAVAGDPSAMGEIDSTQWGRLHAVPFLPWITDMHTHPATGPISLLSSDGEPEDHGKGGDIGWAAKNYGGHPFYIYHYQDGTLREHRGDRQDYGVIVPGSKPPH